MSKKALGEVEGRGRVKVRLLLSQDWAFAKANFIIQPFLVNGRKSLKEGAVFRC